LREAARLAGGLRVDTGRMAENLAVNRGLIFADAAAARLSAHVGREAADAAIARTSDAVRAGRMDLMRALKSDGALPEHARADIDAAFDIGPAVDAAALWAERALQGDRGEADAAPGG
jgi:3-carboxy-cis,cis-muconate cycloisomerase